MIRLNGLKNNVFENEMKDVCVAFSRSSVMDSIWNIWDEMNLLLSLDIHFISKLSLGLFSFFVFFSFLHYEH